METTGIAAKLLPLTAARMNAAARPTTAATAPLQPLASGVLRPLPAGRAATDLRPLGDGGGAAGERQTALQAVKDFEAIFMRQLARVMTQSAGGAAGGIEGSAYYEGLIEEQLGRVLAEAGGGLGLKEALLARMGATTGEANARD